MGGQPPAGPGDLELAGRSLRDTVAVALAASGHPVTRLAAGLPDGARWAVAAHVLDFDDLHMPSTTHVSAVCVPTALATGGGARAYLAAAGVMARLGTALGWRHYSAGWHATCTAGAPASAAGAISARHSSCRPTGSRPQWHWPVPAAGGVQRAFGTDAKSLQVGFAVAAGIRAARLAAAGARADPAALDAWLGLVGGEPAAIDLTGPAVPDGLAIKIYPCCYAMQRPISALTEAAGGSIDPADVRRIVLRTPEATVLPLIHHRPGSRPGGNSAWMRPPPRSRRLPWFASFTDARSARRRAQLAGLVEIELEPGGNWLLDGELAAECTPAARRWPSSSSFRQVRHGGARRRGAAGQARQLVGGLDADPEDWTWQNAAEVLRGSCRRAG